VQTSFGRADFETLAARLSRAEDRLGAVSSSPICRRIRKRAATEFTTPKETVSMPALAASLALGQPERLGDRADRWASHRAWSRKEVRLMPALARRHAAVGYGVAYFFAAALHELWRCGCATAASPTPRSHALHGAPDGERVPQHWRGLLAHRLGGLRACWSA